ncbi:zinc ribbon domain-containing protein [Quadrisphaera sp. KR29]|uniref:zinc ribbon domain-containing protein n=1 Tax=Quadrisphaera sp. KR29 TaxID=3461391 RepID=UPI004044236F
MSATAPAHDQRRLLDVQALDTRLAQVAHRARTLPEHAQVAALDATERTLRDELVAARTLASDVDREATRAETEVEQVRARAQRTSARLAAGGTPAKELQQLLAEAEALTRRLRSLEDSQLEVMERQEVAEQAVAALEQRAAGLAGERAALVAARDTALAAAREEHERVSAQRAGAIGQLDKGLVALYEQVRARRDGLGAAPVVGETCGGCRLPFTGTFRVRVASAAPDDVVQCEECDRILVRAPEPELRR